MSVSKRLRYEILRRDNHACTYCGATAPDVKLTVDHVTPSALGGSDEPGNLTTACAPCNAGKSASSPDAPIVAAVSSDALRWSAAMKQAAEMQQASIREIDVFCTTIDELWTSWATCIGDDEHPVPRPQDWRRSVEMWMRAGVSVDEVVDAIRRAMDNEKVSNSGTWKYTCGIVWGRLRERQEIAKKLIAQTTITDEDEDAGPDVYELDYEVTTTQNWRRLAYMSPDLRRLQRRIEDLCCRVLTEPVSFDSPQVFDGGQEFEAVFGFGARELISDYVDGDHCWSELDLQTIWTYLVRLVYNYFEAVNSDALVAP